MRRLDQLEIYIGRNPDMKILGIRAGDGLAFTWRARRGVKLKVLASIGGGWDHVSVSTHSKTPTYQDMKMVKRFMFKEGEWVIEYHPPASDYISTNDNVLHLWRPQDVEIPRPPEWMV